LRNLKEKPGDAIEAKAKFVRSTLRFGNGFG
jgi:hypothetical protein